MQTLNLFGSTGTIGTKTLNIIKNYFPKININLLVANNNYKKLAKQTEIYKPKYICLTNKNKYINLKKSLISFSIFLNSLEKLTKLSGQL